VAARGRYTIARMGGVPHGAPGQRSLVDRFARVHDELRISVTDRCNLRCAYCMPAKPVWFPRAEILSYEEILRVVRILIRRGVSRFRITGGEPLVRSGITSFVAMMAETPGVEELSLTTNGLLLSTLAPGLARAGLGRINVSLDTLVPERFARMTGRPALPSVLDGLEAAFRAGIRPIKINTVLLRGENDDEVESLVDRARRSAWEVRFIEVMPLENGGIWDLTRVVSGTEVRQRIERHWPLEEDPDGDPRAPATRFLFRDGRGAVGFINSVTEPFCAQCSRIRLTSDGQFRVCLHDPAERDLKAQLRGGAADAALEAAMEDAMQGKGRGGALEILERHARVPPVRTMHQIGG